ncbi:DUF4339 domain-containing protein [Candidatus Fermentibacteria bacterium]|nr:DUF4339 domain-containing protein [Candidatus Fermentibacteria bacterium]
MPEPYERMEAMADEWYLFKDQQRMGPFSWQQLLEKAKSGAIEPTDQVWSEDTGGWIPGSEVEGLFQTPPPPPPPPESGFKQEVPPDLPTPAAVEAAAEQMSKRARPLSVGQYFLVLLLSAIPVVNVVLLLIWSFGSKTGKAKKNLARAILIWLLIVAVVSVGVYLAWLFGVI